MKVEETSAELARFREELRAFSKVLEPLPAAPAGTDDALLGLYLGIASLASVGVAACAEGDLYAARCLTRSVAEHWMRFMSIAAGSAPADFFSDLKDAEAVEIDRRMRNCLPNGQIPTDIPVHVRAAIQGALIQPEPSAAARAGAKDIVQKYQFDKLCRGMLNALKARDGQDDAGGYVSVAFAYARFSACVHGGPLGRDYLTSAPSAHAIASTACDIFVAWTSALTMLLAKTRGPDGHETKAALAVQDAFLAWATGPRGPFGAFAVT
jgi:hypothetical protein